MKRMLMPIMWISIAALTVGLATAMAQERVAKTSEVGLRRRALSSVAPSYPAGSIEAGVSGLAVADIVVAPTGAVQSIEILEAPDQAIAAAVRAALSQWRFPAIALPMQAKMTFYFRIEQGRGRVLNPQDLPGGPAIARAAAPIYSPQNPPPVAAPATKPGTRVLSEADTTPMTVDELQKLTGANRPTLLDVGARASFKRGHLDGAINIPHDELEVRAGIELRDRGRIVIDCTQEQTFYCLFADHVLKDAGFKDVAILRR